MPALYEATCRLARCWLERTDAITRRLLITLVFAIGGLIASVGGLMAAPLDAPPYQASATQTAVALTQTAGVRTLTPTVLATPTVTPTGVVTATMTPTWSSTPTSIATPAVTGTLTATPSPTSTPTVTAPPTAMSTPAVLPDLTITQVDSPVALTGDLLTYTITVTNGIASGPSSNATTMTDEIPAGTVFGSVSGLGCTTVGNLVSCSVPPLAPGQIQVYAIVVQVTGISGTSITNVARVDEPVNLVIELNETNNSAGVTTLIVGPPATSTPAPPATAMPFVPSEPPIPALPLPPVVQPPVAQPQPPDNIWARILFPVQAYSTSDAPLWIAQPGEFYWVMRQEGSWILAVWEGDTCVWAVWIRADGVELITLNRRPPPDARALWVLIFGEVRTYSLTLAPLWVASPGEWYEVIRREDGWTLGRWEGDPPNLAVWIPEGPHLDFATFDVWY